MVGVIRRNQFTSSPTEADQTVCRDPNTAFVGKGLDKTDMAATLAGLFACNNQNMKRQKNKNKTVSSLF